MIAALWRRLMRRPAPRTPGEIATRSLPGNRITEWEAGYIAAALKEQRSPCPDCRKGRFLKGPQDAGSVNVRCDDCGAEFNLYLIPEDEFVIGERLAPRPEHDREGKDGR